MKKSSKQKTKEIKELAGAFNDDLEATLPITKLPNGAVVYKSFIIKQTPTKNWGIYQRANSIPVEEYFLKTCALMAAKAYNHTDIAKFLEIKRLDNRYWASYCDTLVYKKNIKTAKEFERYVILLNKLEHSTDLANHFKEEISKMFKWSFV
jgi:hypothetical protein